MPIDAAKALGASFPDHTVRWNKQQVILYHLAIGAGVPPTDPRELQYTYEKDLKVLPSFVVLPVMGAAEGVTSTPGLNFDLARVLHGEHDLEVAGPLPTEATITSSSRVAEIYDKGNAAVVVLEITSKDASGATLFVNRSAFFLRGEGSFGGEAGPRPGNLPPPRRPDWRVESPTLPQQALLFRLCGDKTPVHVDPEFARRSGFERPLLHGLCTYGVVCKAVVDHALDGDPGRVLRYRVRFGGVVFPGDTIVTSMWREGEKIVIEARTKERGTPVITNAAVIVSDPY